MSETKKIFKLFYIFDLEKEEKWLREMANKGLFFQKVNYLGIFTFKKGSPKDTIYKIDFNRKINDMEEYLYIFREGGWNYLHQIREFKYFRYTGDLSDYNGEVDIYNDPKEQLSWLRKWLVFFLTIYVFEFVCIYSTIFLEDNESLVNPYSIMLLLIIAFLTFVLTRFITSYRLLKKKLKQAETDYYNKTSLKEVSSAFTLLIFPLVTFVVLIFLYTSMQTVSGSVNVVMDKIINENDKGLYPIGNITYVAEKSFDSGKIFLYGNDKRIGIAALKKVFLNRYKIATDFSSSLPSNQFVIFETIKINGDDYCTAYGLDDKRLIEKISLIYTDGSIKSIYSNDFIKEGNYFLIAEKSDKTVKNIKVFDKDNADITDEFKIKN